MRKKLILLRHAKSAWNTPAETDFQRPLSERGITDAPKMGRWMSANKMVPDKLLSSTALRAAQTAECIAQAMGFERRRIIWQENLYHASVRELLRVVTKNQEGVNTLMLVGHNPGLEDLLDYLCMHPLPWRKDGKLLTTAALAVVELAPGPSILKPSTAKLIQLIRPKEIDSG